MSLSEDFARFYGTDNQGNTQMTDEQIKEAMIDLFEKSASESGIDLEKLSADQIRGLYAEWEPEFLKAAAEEGEEKDDDEGEEKEKIEKAKAEHEEKKAALGKYAEAEDMGRVMARSFLDELNKEAASKTGGISSPVDKAKRYVSKGVEGFRKAITGEGTEAARKELGRTEKLVGERKRMHDAVVTELGKEHAGHEAHKLNLAEHAHGQSRTALRKAQAKRVAATTAPVATALLAGKGVHSMVSGGGGGGKSKKASDFDALAAELAVEKAAAADFDPEECGYKIASLFHLDLLEESEKVAAIEDTATALHVRASEMLELAGYPVDWNA
jgi:hypothetical protein